MDQELSTHVSFLLIRWCHFLREMTSWPTSWKRDLKSKIRLFDRCVFRPA